MKKPAHYDPTGGLCMKCNKKAFFDALASVPEVECFNYVEIGVFNGNTLKWACDYLSSSRPLWAAYGVEIKKWMPHEPHVRRILGDYWDGSIVESIDDDHDIPKPRNGVIMFTCGSIEFLTKSLIEPSFVFIDGCHSVSCCTKDFLMSEDVIQKCGVIAIHDIDRSYQGLDPGEHCHEGIGVLQAIKNLGLFDKTRKGWKEIGRSPEDYENHGCLFVQRE